MISKLTPKRVAIFSSLAFLASANLHVSKSVDAQLITQQSKVSKYVRPGRFLIQHPSNWSISRESNDYSVISGAGIKTEIILIPNSFKEVLSSYFSFSKITKQGEVSIGGRDALRVWARGGPRDTEYITTLIKYEANRTYVITSYPAQITSSAVDLIQRMHWSFRLLDKSPFETSTARISQAQSFLKEGIYNAGSRYITIIRNGNRTCYSGVSFPSRRYSLAVGETTGSVSLTDGKWVIDGWKQQYGKNVVLNQVGNILRVTHDSRVAGEYSFFQTVARGNLSVLLQECLNSSESYFSPHPGYTINIPQITSLRKYTPPFIVDAIRRFPL